MHSDELDIDAALVARLIAAQFPQWADLPIVKAPSAGTDHAMYRLADDMVVRLPRIPGAARQVDKEQRWLPHLAPQLPLQVPVPLGRGVPGQGFPMPWSVYAWLDGENAFDRPIIDLRDAAIELGGFVAALRSVDATGGPQSSRGGPVSTRDDDVRAASATWAPTARSTEKPRPPPGTRSARSRSGKVRPAGCTAISCRATC